MGRNKIVESCCRWEIFTESGHKDLGIKVEGKKSLQGLWEKET